MLLHATDGLVLITTHENNFHIVLTAMISSDHHFHYLSSDLVLPPAVLGTIMVACPQLFPRRHLVQYGQGLQLVCTANIDSIAKIPVPQTTKHHALPKDIHLKTKKCTRC